ncbi:hypothetical protein DSN65_05635, partial [Pediococcus acidilactici]
MSANEYMSNNFATDFVYFVPTVRLEEEFRMFNSLSVNSLFSVINITSINWNKSSIQLSQHRRISGMTKTLKQLVRVLWAIEKDLRI